MSSYNCGCLLIQVYNICNLCIQSDSHKNTVKNIYNFESSGNMKMILENIETVDNREVNELRN